jgi:hypothetical protein
MKTMPDIVLATRRGGAAKPRLPKDWNVRSVTLKTLVKNSKFAPITIVDTLNPKVFTGNRDFTRALAKRFEEGSRSHFLVLTFEEETTIEPDVKVKLLMTFAHPERVEISEDIRAMPRLVENLAAKIRALDEREANGTSREPRLSPLDEVRGVLFASRDLRVQNGNLSASAIARVFGISLNALARLLGRTRQALNKTPDADSLQTELSFFERVARLRAALRDDAEFRQWLRIPRAELSGETPLRWMARKRWQALADLVDDMLTGAPV